MGARATERTPRDKQKSMGAQHFVGGVVPGVLTVVTIAKHGFLNLSQAKYGVRKKGSDRKGNNNQKGYTNNKDWYNKRGVVACEGCWSVTRLFSIFSQYRR